MTTTTPLVETYEAALRTIAASPRGGKPFRDRLALQRIANEALAGKVPEPDPKRAQDLRLLEAGIKSVCQELGVGGLTQLDFTTLDERTLSKMVWLTTQVRRALEERQARALAVRPARREKRRG